jgi:predicted CXXCH cytochrome family protein
MYNTALRMTFAVLLVLSGTLSCLAADPQSFAGSASCAECHMVETKAWRDSDHGWALREPTAANVLGDFSGVTFSNRGVTSRFFMRNGRYVVETDGADGKLAQFPVAYTVGVRPLQQYLIETDKGRLQVLDIAWDVTARKWYNLYPDQDAAAGNGLHWTGSYKNWQGRCAQCHQTGFEKNFDLPQQTYKSHWAELTVSCESCHGPSSDHVAWARQYKGVTSPPEMPPMLKLGPGHQAAELAVCGPCHSRREAFEQNNAPVGTNFSDHYNLSLLTPGLYFADGQQDGEVYILGSFLQSKMMSKGVTCSNCHESHGGKLVADGNAVCTQCHSPAGRTEFPSLKLAAYDTPSHTHHKDGSTAAQCVSCHMPERTYMGIDKRRDHFFRMPDPLQSKAAGAPDACTGCHTDKSPEWAAQQIAAWLPSADRSWQDRTPLIAFANGDRTPDALAALAGYARNLNHPAIVRATAIAALRDSGAVGPGGMLAPLLSDQSDLVRTAVVGVARGASQADRYRLLAPLLADPVRAVRQAAAVELVGDKDTAMSDADAAALNKAIAEYQASRAANGDMPESHMALAGLALNTRNWETAESEFSLAAAMDPQLDSAWLMMARLRSALGDEAGAAMYLDKGLGYQPRSIDLIFERASLESRANNDKKAIDWYRRLVAVDPSRTDAWLAMADAALRAKETDIAIDATDHVLASQPDNVDALVLSSIAHYIRGDMDQAKEDARHARRIAPKVQLPPEIEKIL